MHLSIDTILPADSVEFCPHPDASNVFVCGTYKLQDEKNSQRPSDSTLTTPGAAGQKRTGQCLVFEVDSEQDDIRGCAHTLLFMSPWLRGTQVQDTGDISSCSLGSKMVRSLSSHAAGPMRDGIVLRCHTTQSRRPLLAVADAEGGVNMFEWDPEQVSYRLFYKYQIYFLILPIQRDAEAPGQY